MINLFLFDVISYPFEADLRASDTLMQPEILHCHKIAVHLHNEPFENMLLSPIYLFIFFTTVFV